MEKIPFQQIPDLYMRQLFERLDKIIYILSQPPNIVNDKLNAILTSSLVPALPTMTEQIIVGTGPTLLAQNNSLDLQRVDITNGDFAQPLFVGGLDVNVNHGRIINPQDTISYVLPKQGNLYGVVAIATISVRISYLNVPYNILSQVIPQ